MSSTDDIDLTAPSPEPEEEEEEEEESDQESDGSVIGDQEEQEPPQQPLPIDENTKAQMQAALLTVLHSKLQRILQHLIQTEDHVAGLLSKELVLREL